MSRRPLTTVLALALLAVQPQNGGADEAATRDAVVKKISLWDNTYNLKTWSGYKDNILFGHENHVASPFSAAGLDAFLWRMPDNGWEFQILGSGEYIRYLDTPSVEKEATGFLQAQAKRTLNAHWKAALSAEYLYFNQVFDNSQFDNTINTVPVEGHGLTLRPSLRREWKDGAFLELEPALTRQMFAEVVDDEWQKALKLSFGRTGKSGTEFSAGGLLSSRQFDTRQPRGAAEQFIPGKSLEFLQPELFTLWRQTWDKDRHWRTVARFSLQRSADNGSGYYDYWRPRLSGQLRYSAKTWQVRAEGRLTYYGYDSQPIDGAGSPIREKTLVQTGLRAEKTFFKRLKLFAEYEHEHAISNLITDDYVANTVFGGVDWEF